MRLILSILLMLCLYNNSNGQQLSLQQEIHAWNSIRNNSQQNFYFRSNTGRYQGYASRTGNTVYFRNSKGKLEATARTNGNITTIRNQQGKNLGTITGKKK